MPAAWGVSEADRDLLKAVVPQTRMVTAEHAGELRTGRRRLFFKPVIVVPQADESGAP